MKYTESEVLQFVRQEDVKFIRLAFCDIFGEQKNVAILPSELESAFKYGVAFDASAIRGFGGKVRSDLFLKPDPATLSAVPWRSDNGRVVRMFCDICYPDDSIFEGDSRHILRRAIAEAEKRGLHFYFGAEMEFYLFTLDENGVSTGMPHDRAGYMDIAPDDRGENVRRDICQTLSLMGIHPECSHHEEGPGQNEIDIRYSEPLSAADNAVTFKSVVKTISARNGLCADFSPKPLKDEPGSGLHINVSVTSDDGKDCLEHMIAGIMDKIDGITLFLNPCRASYERLGSKKAPGYVSWSRENRSQLIRIPAARNGKERAELRSPDPCANPYIAFALLIYAGLYGIENELPLSESADFNLFSAPCEVLKKYKTLPASFDEAADRMRNAGFASLYLPEELIKAYCEA